MSGDWYYNDLDSREFWDGAPAREDSSIDEALTATWDRESIAYRTWMNADYGDIDMALNYFDTVDDGLDQFADLEILEGAYPA